MTRPIFPRDAEQSVIARILKSPEQMDVASNLVAPDDFYDQDMRMMFIVLTEMSVANDQIDVIMLHERMVEKGLDSDLAYLCELVRNIPAGDVAGYCQTIKEYSDYRALMFELTDMAQGYPETNQRAASLVSDAQERLLRLSERKGRLQRSSFDMLRSSVDRIDKIMNGQLDPMGIPYGILEVDKMTSGARESQLIVIAARPGDGKTNAGIKVVRNAVFRKGKAAMMFSLEMEGEQIMNRVLASENNIDAGFFKQPDASDYHCIEKIGAFSTRFRQELEEKLIIHDDASLTPTQIRARCIAAKRILGDSLSVIVIDYLQLVTPDKDTGNRANDVGAMSRFFKKMAMELGIPVVVLSQLNRGAAGRSAKDSRPRVTDLRESGAIEQDADLIILLYRPETIDKKPENVGIAEYIIGKQREGETGIVIVDAAFKYNDFREVSLERLAAYTGGVSNEQSVPTAAYNDF